MNFKLLTVVLIFALFNVGFSQSFDVELIKPNATASQINDAYFINEQKGWMAAGGRILITSDSGKSWIEVNMTPYVMTNVYFINEKVGFAIGYSIYSSAGKSKIFKTTDGGYSWSQKFEFNFNYYYTKYDFTYFKGDYGVLYVDGYRVYKTFDQGNTWTFFSSTNYFSEVEFYNEKIGYAAGAPVESRWFDEEGNYMTEKNTGIYYTSNGGLTWTLGKSCTIDYEKINDIQIIDSNTVVAGGIQWVKTGENSESGVAGSVIMSTDGGKNWCKKGSENFQWEYDYAYKMVYITTDTAFLLTSPFNYWYTVDGWKTVKNGTLFNSYLAHLQDRETMGMIRAGKSIILYGNNGILNRIVDYRNPHNIEYLNGYKNPFNSALYKDITDIDLAGCHIFTNYGYSQSDYYSDNCGKSWVETLANWPEQWDMKFTDDYNGYQINQNGLFRTSNSAETWVKDTKFDNSYCNKSSELYLSGNNGLLKTDTILYTTENGGSSWEKVFETKSLSGIWIHDENLMFYYSKDRTSKIFKSENLGKTWMPVSLGEDSLTIYNVQFITKDLGFASGSKLISDKFPVTTKGIMLITKDGGQTWKRYGGNLMEGTTEIKVFKFFNESIGYYASKGMLRRTVDGGQDWDENLISTSPILTLESYRDSVLYIGGKYGLLASTSVPPIPIVTNRTERNLINDLVYIYPNPSNESVTVSVKNEKIELINIYDTNGNKIKKILPGPDTDKVIIQLDQLVSGVYFVQVQFGNLSYTNKLIKN